MKWFREHSKLSAVIAVFTVLVIMIVASYINTGSSTPLGRGISTVVSFVQKPLSSIGGGISNGFTGIFRFRTVLNENEALKERIASLEAELVSAMLTEQELIDLRNLAELLRYENVVGNNNYVSADVIALDSSSWFNLFTVNVGTDDGVEEYSVVINGDGLVGRVYEVGPNWAKVISIIDESTKVSFRIFTDLEQVGILAGDGNGSLTGYMLDPDATVTEGQSLVTSGMGIYPAGLTIGRISNVVWDKDLVIRTLEIEPAVNFKSLNKVTVVTPGYKTTEEVSGGGYDENGEWYEWEEGDGQ